jgi:hypothetical protein
MLRLALIVVAALAVPTLGLAADAAVSTMPKHHAYRTHGPYPLSWRAAKIRHADGCWRACLADTGRDFQACLRAHGPNVCVSWNAGANHFCLDACRLAGGPWVE